MPQASDNVQTSRARSQPDSVTPSAVSYALVPQACPGIAAMATIRPATHDILETVICVLTGE
jgi:hypothetical protein